MVSRQAKMKGCMVGMVVGDALGSTYEFSPVIHPKEVQKIDKKILLTMKGGGKFKLEPGNWTDDASQGLALAHAFMENRSIEPSTEDKKIEVPSVSFMNNICDWWEKNYYSGRTNSVGLGAVIAISIKEWPKYRSNSRMLLHPAIVTKNAVTNKNKLNECDGNGSIMRCAAAAIYGKNPIDAARLGYEQSIVTTPGRQSADCARLLTYLCNQAMSYSHLHPIELKKFLLSKENLKNFLNEANQQELLSISERTQSFSIQAVPIEKQVSILCQNQEKEGANEDGYLKWDVDFKNYQLREKTTNTYYGAYVMEGMALALHIIRNTNSFEEAVTFAALMQGDADSNAAVVGQLAGAIYGFQNIPAAWVTSIDQHKFTYSSNPRSGNNTTSDTSSKKEALKELKNHTVINFIDECINHANQIYAPQQPNHPLQGDQASPQEEKRPGNADSQKAKLDLSPPSTEVRELSAGSSRKNNVLSGCRSILFGGIASVGLIGAGYGLGSILYPSHAINISSTLFLCTAPLTAGWIILIAGLVIAIAAAIVIKLALDNKNTAQENRRG